MKNKGKRLYIKIYSDDESEDVVEKVYQICNEEKLPKVIKMLNEILADQEADSYADVGMPDQYDNMTGSMNL